MEGSRSNPDIEIYKAVRAHEVMLNQAVSTFEHAVYTRLAALNGGAAAAFVTLLGTQIKSTGGQLVSIPPAAVAVVAWLSGLLAASLAAVFGFRRQRAVNHGYRLMREEAEHKLGRGNLADVVSASRTTEEKDRLQELEQPQPELTARLKLWGKLSGSVSPTKRKEKKEREKESLKKACDDKRRELLGVNLLSQEDKREREKAAEDWCLRKAYGQDAGRELARFNLASGISVGLFIAGAIAALIAVVV